MTISNRDWVQLSSYLDGELSSREVKRLEDRFTREPALQFALEELHQSKKTLQSTPKLRIPRNFTLSPDMVGITRRPHQARSYRLAAVLMSFMLIGVLVLDFGSVFMSGAMAPAAPKEVMLEALPEAAADAIEDPALMASETELEEADRAVAGAEADAPMEEEAPSVVADAVEEDEVDGVAEEVAVEEEEIVGETADAESKSTEGSGPDTTANQTDEWQEGDAAQELAASRQTSEPEPTQTQVPLPTEQLFFSDETPTITRSPGIDPFQILEVIFALGAISFAIAAWVVSRRNP